MQKKTLYIVVPCYNEEAVLLQTAERLRIKMEELANVGKITQSGKIVFVDDGSRDSTWQIIENLSVEHSIFAGVKLSRNRGHQHALYAGLMAVYEQCDFVISIDADLQDDIESIGCMVDEYLSGSDIVYGVRRGREQDGFFKRVTAERYYKLLQRCGCDIVYNHADYRLMSSTAVDALSEFREQRLFLRGLAPLIGFKTSVVEYDRGVREAGESKYPLRRMLGLAFDGLFTLSFSPLRIITCVGVVMMILSAVLFVYSIVLLISGQSLPDWMVAVFSTWAVGGIVTLSIGIVGEYVGRASLDIKNRPRYIVECTVGFRETQKGVVEQGDERD